MNYEMYLIVFMIKCFNVSGTMLHILENTKHDLIQYTITGPRHPRLSPAHTVVYYHWNMIGLLGRSGKVCKKGLCCCNYISI